MTPEQHWQATVNAPKADWQLRLDQVERLHQSLDRFVKSDDRILSDRAFAEAVLARFTSHMQAHIVDVCE